MPVANITLLEGAGAEKKRAVIAKVTQALAESLEIPAASVRVLLNEIPAENWGVAGRSLADTSQ